MTIKQQGGVFGRHPTFSTVTAEATNTAAGVFDRYGSDGSVVSFLKSGSALGSIGNSGTRMYIDGAGATGLQFSSGALIPRNLGAPTNGVINLGAASNRFNTVYAATGTINTSDERQKQDIRDLSAAEAAVAVRLKGLVKAYRFKSAYEKKGDDARIHVGVIAQEVTAAFEAEGLDPMRYGVVCYDQWGDVIDDDGNVTIPAGNSCGVRYDELWAFIITAI